MFLQNILRFLIAVKHSILSESDDLKLGSAISVQREVALFVV